MNTKKLKTCEDCIHHDYCNYKENYQEFSIICNEFKEDKEA